MLKYPDSVWYGLVARCVPGGAQQRASKTYVGCTVGFKDKADFVEWIEAQPGFNKRDEKGRRFNIDKDLIIEGNKIYGRDQCCLVPARLNCILLDCGVSASGGLPGCSWHKASGFYQSRVQTLNGRMHLGVHPTQISAHNAWRAEKSAELRRAVAWYEAMDGHDERVIAALIRKARELSLLIEEV